MSTWLGRSYILGIALVCTTYAVIHTYPFWLQTSVPHYFGTLLYHAESSREVAVATAQLFSMPPADSIDIPVLHVSRAAIVDTFGQPRGTDRTHEGTDIFAPRGTYIRSATPGIVLHIGQGTLGGNLIFILGPGGERYYYAHLDTIDPVLAVGQYVSTTTLLGTVGTTGNAVGTPPHLHFGIYGPTGAVNPYERLR